MESEKIGQNKLLTLKETAETMRKSYSWVSRSWKTLGLSPSRVGRTLVFMPADVAAALGRLRVSTGRRGRPRKVGQNAL